MNFSPQDTRLTTNRRRILIELGAAAALGHSISGSARAQNPPVQNASGVKVEKDVVVGNAGDTELHCDIYRPPPGKEKRMALIHFHGGAFVVGSKNELAPKVTPLAARGYVSVAAQYRLGGASQWPSQIEDAKLHIRWVREHADSLGIDPKRIGLAGYSAGGYIAVYTAGQPDAGVAACIASYPAPEVTRGVMPPGSDDAAVKATGTFTQIHEGYPPTVIYHGLADTTIPPENSQRLLQALRDAKVPCELHTFAGVPHEFDAHPEFAEACAAITDFFLDREVLNPRTYPPFGPGGGRGRGRGPA
jgi:acetyl esterase